MSTLPEFIYRSKVTLIKNACFLVDLEKLTLKFIRKSKEKMPDKELPDIKTNYTIQTV